MLVQTITTPLAYLWYEIWESFDGTQTCYTAYRYNAELGRLYRVAVEWKECHAYRMVRHDMANLGIDLAVA